MVEVTTDILPTANSTYNVGNVFDRFNTLYCNDATVATAVITSGNFTCDTLDCGGFKVGSNVNITGGINSIWRYGPTARMSWRNNNIQVFSNYDCGDASNVWNNLYYDGVLNPSDENVKSYIQPTMRGLRFLEKLKTRQYRMNKELKTGFIVDEVMDVLNQENFSWNAIDTAGIDYSSFICLLVKAIQELSDLIDEDTRILNLLSLQLNIK